MEYLSIKVLYSPNQLVNNNPEKYSELLASNPAFGAVSLRLKSGWAKFQRSKLKENRVKVYKWQVAKKRKR